MNKKIFLFILLSVFILHSNLHMLNSESTQEKKYQKKLKHEVTVILKLVQVYVMDKGGEPVTDLKKSDFVLYDNGKLKTITDFEKHFLLKPEKMVEEKTKPETPGHAAESPKINRKFIFILDYDRNTLGGIRKSKEAVLHFIETQVQHTDEVGLFSYSSFRGLILHEYLTTDHRKIRELINGLKDVPGRIVHGILMDDKRAEIYKDDPFKIIENSRLGDFIKRRKSHNFCQDIKNLAKAFRYIPGHKNIVFFSAGLTTNLVYNIKGRNSLLRDNYEEMCKELATANCPVFAVNTEEILTKLEERGKQGEDTLMRLSEVSGGKYFGSVNNYEKIAENIQNMTGNYYILGYYADEQWDGRFHEIKVEVKRKGCRVYAQHGYFNLKPFTQFSPLEKQLHLIGLALNRKSYLQEILDFPLIALPCSHKHNSNLVLLSEISLENLEDVIKRETEIITLIFDKENNIIDFIKGEVNFSAIPHEKIYHYTISSLEPGSYECRIVIRNLKTGDERMDIFLIELQLPQLRSGEYSLDLIAEEIKTKSKSQATQTFRIR